MSDEMGDWEKWGRFDNVDGLIVVCNISRKAIDLLAGFFVIAVMELPLKAWSLVCADDPPVRRIRTFTTFAAARRFMSSLVLRGMTRKMKVMDGTKIAEEGGI